MTRLQRSTLTAWLAAHRWPVAIFLFALAIRLVGIGYGLPYVYTADNETSFVWPAAQMNKEGRLHPLFFGHPGSTVIYPFALLIRLLFWWQLATGRYPSYEEFDRAFWADPTDVFLLLRSYTAILGAVSVALTYLVARGVFGDRAALAGAALTAVAPLQHEYSRMARTDIPTTIFGLLTTWAGLRLYQTGAHRWYLAAGAAAGLAAASKFPGGSALAVLAVAHLLAWWTGRTRLVGLGPVLGGLGFLAGFFGSSPYLLLDYPTALKDIAAELETSHLGADRLPGLWNYLWYFYGGFPTALSWPVWIVALPAALGALRRDTARRLVFAAFPAAYLLLVTSGTLRWAHWVIPAIPYVAVWAGWGLATAAAWLACRRNWLPSARYAFGAGLAVVAVWPTFQVVAADYRSLLPDTRTLATNWYAEHLPKGAKVAFEHYAGKPPEGIQLDLRGLLGNKPLAAYRSEHYEYLVVSEYMYGRVYAEPQKFAREVSIYDELFRETELMQEFDPRVLGGWLGKRGPTIRVLRVPPTTAERGA
ncbi:MAG: glycosyltransferase family 39 protein [Chloroflexi bacterium]|nr:glycosyltransferase family 39 protein [Chloroflexota bacterium]